MNRMLKNLPQWRDAQEKWSQVPLPKRIQRVSQFIEAMDLDQDLASSLLSSVARLPQNDAGVFPLGFVVIIGGGGDVLAEFLRRLVIALVGGNAVCFHPSTRNPLPCDSNHLAKVFNVSEIPENLLILEPEKHEFLLDHPSIGGVLFWGKTETGERIRDHLIAQGKRFQGSMSSTNPAFVFSGCDLKTVAKKILKGVSFFEKRIDLRISRVCVQEKIFDLFCEELERLMALMPSVKKSYGESFSSACEEALSEGGKLIGHEVDQGIVLVKDMSLCSELNQREVLGPFVIVSRFKYPFDLNKKILPQLLYKKAAYLFQPDRDKALRLAETLPCSRIFLDLPGPYMDFNEEIEAFGLSDWGASGPKAWYSFLTRKNHVVSPSL